MVATVAQSPHSVTQQYCWAPELMLTLFGGTFLYGAIESTSLFIYSTSISASEMTYIVSSGALNSTHSLTSTSIFHLRRCRDHCIFDYSILCDDHGSRL